MNALLASIPMGLAKAAIVALLIVPVIWAVRLKRDFIYLGSPGQERWRDLRIWAVVVTVPYVLIYLFL